MINYLVCEETKTMKGEEYLTYGIIAECDGEEERMVSDISLDKEEVVGLADLLNEEKVELIHFQAVVEDYLVERGIIFN